MIIDDEQNRFPSLEQEYMSQESVRSFESLLYRYNEYYLLIIDVLNNSYNRKIHMELVSFRDTEMPL